MIKITLEFNSWEEAVAYMSKGEKAVADVKAPAELPKPVTKPAATPAAAGTKVAKPETATGSPSDPKAAAAASTPAAPVASTASSTVDYASLQKAVFALANKSREAASAVVAAFGVKTFRDLPADKWESALTAVNAKRALLEKAE